MLRITLDVGDGHLNTIITLTLFAPLNFYFSSVKTMESNPVSNASSSLLLRQTSIDQNNDLEINESRPSSIHPMTLRATSSPNEDDINVHKR